MTADDSASLQRIDAATRKAIRDSFPMGSIMKYGTDNPLTIHSADPQLFRAIYTLIAETMSVESKLDRSTKEKIATMVSERNQCPVCIVAHTMMESVASGVEKSNNKATEELDGTTEIILKHAASVVDALENTRQGGKESTTNDGPTPSLDEATQAEIALVVLIFDHMNRVVSAIMGEEMSTAMIGVPRVLARQMEKPGLVAAMSRCLTCLLGGPFRAQNKPGMTQSLFIEDETEEMSSAFAASLPDHLSGVKFAGGERAVAVARLLEWSKSYETKLWNKGCSFLSRDIVRVLDRAIAHKTASDIYAIGRHPGNTIRWANACVEDFRSEIDKLADQDAGSSIVALLLCLSLVPQVVYQSPFWDKTIQKLGKERARCLVFWWSLRMTLRDAARLKLSSNTVVK